ncbi:expressed unknown protein [Seminavis robusta]|uniref:Uncharacterized protein n=1 Tax=Seminavis robusta TaxID=568900 RepID=A0A9N8D9N3_9STRA|nr:expressed unknown protein [Seminavis robusta]|eukprot:Sro47_g027970.1 n/a (648) ;mRNA; f:136571-138514
MKGPSNVPSLRRAHQRVGSAAGSVLGSSSSPLFQRSKQQSFVFNNPVSQAFNVHKVRNRRLILRFVLLGVIFFFLTSSLVMQHRPSFFPLGEFNNDSSSGSDSGSASGSRSNAVPDSTKDSSILRGQVNVPSFRLNNNNNNSSATRSTSKARQDLLLKDDTVVHSFYDPLAQMEGFLRSHADTPGARFIQLLQANLYNSKHNHEELQRLQACQTQSRHNPQLVNVNLCFAGSKNYKNTMAHLEQLAQELNNIKPMALLANVTAMEQHTPITINMKQQQKTTKTLAKNNKPIQASTVFQMRRYGPINNSAITMDRPTRPDIEHRLIPNLGTSMACLPLLLAGAAVAFSTDDDNPHLAVELGPYFGLSSKCLATGLTLPGSTSSSVPPLYFAYDTFGGRDNLLSLQNRSQTQWILDDYFPHFGGGQNSDNNNNDDTSFRFLWQRAVLPVHPTARAIAGMLVAPTAAASSHDTVYQRARSIQQQQPSLDLLVMDSAKSAKAWNDQLMAVLGPTNTMIHAGNILILMDFEFVAVQVKQVYGCLRQALLPVYISWNHEHFAFVVTQDIDLTTKTHANCYAGIAQTHTDSLHRLEQQVQADLDFVRQGLRQHEDQQNNIKDKKWDSMQQPLLDHMVRNLREKPEQWMGLARMV